MATGRRFVADGVYVVYRGERLCKLRNPLVAATLAKALDAPSAPTSAIVNLWRLDGPRPLVRVCRRHITIPRMKRLLAEAGMELRTLAVWHEQLHELWTYVYIVRTTDLLLITPFFPGMYPMPALRCLWRWWRKYGDGRKKRAEEG